MIQHNITLKPWKPVEKDSTWYKAEEKKSSLKHRPDVEYIQHTTKKKQGIDMRVFAATDS